MRLLLDGPYSTDTQHWRKQNRDPRSLICSNTNTPRHIWHLIIIPSPPVRLWTCVPLPGALLSLLLPLPLACTIFGFSALSAPSLARHNFAQFNFCPSVPSAYFCCPSKTTRPPKNKRVATHAKKVTNRGYTLDDADWFTPHL